MKKALIGGFGLFVILSLSSCGGNSGQNLKETSSPNENNSDSSKTEVFEELSKKKTDLIALKGEHPLQSISGTSGANTMIDFYQEKGKWTASGSSIMEGMREPFDIPLSKDDLNKLKTMRMVVSDDLSVTLFCGNKEFFKAPFQEEGFSYFIKNSPQKYSSYMSENLKPNSTYLDEYLYFFAKDHLKESEVEFLNIGGILADGVVVKYNTKSKEFELVLFYGDCCDQATYTF